MTASAATARCSSPPPPSPQPPPSWRSRYAHRARRWLPRRLRRRDREPETVRSEGRPPPRTMVIDDDRPRWTDDAPLCGAALAARCHDPDGRDGLGPAAVDLPLGADGGGGE